MQIRRRRERPGESYVRVRERKHGCAIPSLRVSPTRICTFPLRQTNAISTHFTAQLRKGLIFHTSLCSPFNTFQIDQTSLLASRITFVYD